MEYFFSIAGERSGPTTQFQVIERIREGKLNGTELVWHKGAPEWQPLKDLQEFVPYWPLTPEQIAQADEARRLARMSLDRPQPWLRFWARIVDYIWFNLLMSTLVGMVLPQEKIVESVNTLQSQFVGVLVPCFILLAYVPLEAWCLSRFGTTPGKSLLRIQVSRREGGFPTFQQALRRSLLVYWKGMAFGLELPALFTMSFARVKLLRTGTTTWDFNSETRVEHGEPEMWRFFTLSGIVCVMAIIVIGALLMNHQFVEALRSGLQK